jgi:hypothetical protein
MQAINRWRNWKPTGEKFMDSSYPEVPKVPKPPSDTFGTSIPGQTKNFSDGVLAGGSAAWAEDFHRWALSNCVYRDRRFGGIGALHTDFCRWTLSHDSVPCRDETFKRLLRDAGFFFADGLVYGLMLKDNWDVSVPFRAPRTHARERNEE